MAVSISGISSAGNSAVRFRTSSSLGAGQGQSTPQLGGLAGAVRTEEGEQLAPPDLEVHTSDRFEALVRFGRPVAAARTGPAEQGALTAVAAAELAYLNYWLRSAGSETWDTSAEMLRRATPDRRRHHSITAMTAMNRTIGTSMIGPPAPGPRLNKRARLPNSTPGTRTSTLLTMCTNTAPRDHRCATPSRSGTRRR